MAKKKKKPRARPRAKKLYTGSPSKWFRTLVTAERVASVEGDDIAAGLAYRKRIAEAEYLKESIRIARKYVAGFEAKDGYDLTKVARLNPAKLAKLRRVAPRIRQAIASPFVAYRPRSKGARRALQRHTGLDDVPGLKVFPVHVPKPERAKVRVKGRKYKSLEITETIKGRQHHDRFFYLSDYLKGEAVRVDKRGRKSVRKYNDRPPETFEDILRVAKRMIAHMPKGYYVVETSSHGTIGIHMPRSELLSELRSRYLGYDTLKPGGKDSRGLAETVIGFRLVSSNLEFANREYNERLTNRVRLQRARTADRARRSRNVTRRLKLQGK